METIAEQADVVTTEAAKETNLKKSAVSTDNKELKTAAESNKSDEEIESDDPEDVPQST